MPSNFHRLFFLFLFSLLTSGVITQNHCDSTVPFWFLQVSDIHLSFRESYRLESLELIFRDIVPAVDPYVTVITGDITHSVDESGLGRPLEAEWKQYEYLLNRYNLSYPKILDIWGNHDMRRVRRFGDVTNLYRSYSPASNYFEPNLDASYSTLYEGDFGSIQFVSVDGYTGRSQDIFNFFGHLSMDKVQYIAERVQFFQGNGTILFGHFPSVTLSSSSTYYGGVTFRDVLASSRVIAYLSGHLHKGFGTSFHSPWWPDHPALDLKYTRALRLAAVHKGVFSFTDLFLPPLGGEGEGLDGFWPVGLVVSPFSPTGQVRNGSLLLAFHPGDTDMAVCVQVLAFSSVPVASVTGKLESSDWAEFALSASSASSPLYSAVVLISAGVEQTSLCIEILDALFRRRDFCVLIESVPQYDHSSSPSPSPPPPSSSNHSSPSGQDEAKVSEDDETPTDLPPPQIGPLWYQNTLPIYSFTSTLLDDPFSALFTLPGDSYCDWFRDRVRAEGHERLGAQNMSQHVGFLLLPLNLTALLPCCFVLSCFLCLVCIHGPHCVVCWAFPPLSSSPQPPSRLVARVRAVCFQAVSSPSLRRLLQTHPPRYWYLTPCSVVFYALYRLSAKPLLRYSLTGYVGLVFLPFIPLMVGHTTSDGPIGVFSLGTVSYADMTVVSVDGYFRAIWHLLFHFVPLVVLLAFIEACTPYEPPTPPLSRPGDKGPRDSSSDEDPDAGRRAKKGKGGSGSEREEEGDVEALQRGSNGQVKPTPPPPPSASYTARALFLFTGSFWVVREFLFLATVVVLYGGTALASPLFSYLFFMGSGLVLRGLLNVLS
eukprot:GCRY01002032.1.p1 GENE.GCRY01002032.1~~GCRY01002032.1.p1  ORF type:complete len:823 (+),score=198.74 GCRY01002032.1:248-2716(+)